MPTNIEDDESLMNKALKVTGLKTQPEVVELGLKTLIQIHNQQAIRELPGKLVY